MHVKSNVGAEGQQVNHNQSGPRVKNGLKAGGQIFNHNQSLVRARLLVLIGLVTLVGSTATAHAEAKCTLAGAAGDWGFTDNGSVVGIGPRVALGRYTADAAGNLLNGKATVNLNGAISSEAFSGKLTVSADCTGSANVYLFDPSGNKIATITAQFVFFDNMREVREIFTSVVLANGTPLTTVITLDAKRLFPEDDD